MTGWLIVNGFLKTSKFEELTQMFVEAARECHIPLKVVDNHCFLAGEKIPEEGKPDFVVFWDKDVLLAKFLENAGIKVFNSSEFISICDDKRKTFLALEHAGLPIPKTILAPMTYDKTDFSDLSFLPRIMDELGFPMVVKEAYGSFGEQVYKVDDEKQLYELIGRIPTTELLFQEFIEESAGRDIRLQVVGDGVCSSMIRTSEHDFRANITAGGSMHSYEPEQKAMDLAILAVKKLGGDFAGVDLLFTEHGYVICEINSNAHFKNLYQCTGVNTAACILEYIKEELR